MRYRVSRPQRLNATFGGCSVAYTEMGHGGTGGDGQKNVLRVLWRDHLHYKVKTDNASHVMSD
jgi:hypothetical protein